MSRIKQCLILSCALSLLGMLSLTWAERGPEGSSVIPASYTHPISRKIHTVAVPAETVINIALSEPLNSKSAQIGKPIIATVTDPLYVGPYLAVPAGSILSGTLTDINRKTQKEGPNPYIIVTFEKLNLPGYHHFVSINASLIAYKTGLQGEDYLWKLPQKKDKLKDRLGSAAEGAAVGFFANPILGPIIGAGAGVLKSVTIDKVAQHGSINIKAGEVIPIAIQDAFKVPITVPSAGSS